jgi:ER-bound oxygenase mpaB/B'/Rubber oxygenase, catalytic domain
MDTAVLISAMTLFPLPPLDLEDNDVPEPGDELIAQDWADPRSSIAISRVNFLHGRWKNKISNDDLLYTLSLFLLEPAHWVNRYEWRKMTPLEEEALFTVWYHAGRCMGITGIPDTRQAMAEWAESYEAEHMVYKESNTAVARYTVDLLLYSIPSFLHGPLYYVVYSLLNERLRESFGFPKAPQWLVASMPPLLRFRSWVSMLLLPRSAVPTSICPADAQKRIIEGGASGQFCPATGISAHDAEKQGKMCPVGNHSMASADARGDDLTSLPRLQPGWIENDPWYVEPAKVGTSRWIWEKIAVKPQDRWGAPKWQNKELHGADASQGKRVAGFRLEECVSRASVPFPLVLCLDGLFPLHRDLSASSLPAASRS